MRFSSLILVKNLIFDILNFSGWGTPLRYYPPKKTFFLKYTSYAILIGSICWGIMWITKYIIFGDMRADFWCSRAFFADISTFFRVGFFLTAYPICLIFGGMLEGDNAQGLCLQIVIIMFFWLLINFFSLFWPKFSKILRPLP